MKEDLEQIIVELRQLLEEKTSLLEQSQRDLQNIREQVIKNEKLATLGLLSAGIAHEIKNPLNFINNFSELSIEFLSEIDENLEKVNPNEAIEEIKTILEDVKSNLEKIKQHGIRINRIVTSMLLHARGSNGNFEPTDINQLIKEYVNLAFHGMRAGKEPINVKIELNLDENIKPVPLNPEDFSRVILNLCNNAFDAMRGMGTENQDKENPGRPATLTVYSKLDGQWVHIIIEDNGPGIPSEIKDKILQPFFTTKKGTQGTGLGLSITSDIIKAHQGVLEIESKEDQFTKFLIKIPTK